MNIIAYEASFGEVRFPEGFEETIRGLTIEEQLNHYRTTESRSVMAAPWRERRDDQLVTPVTEDRHLRGLIVRDGIVVGVLLNSYPWGELRCLAEKSVCTYDSSDNNGAGYRSRTDYTGLVCMPPRAE